MPFQVMAVKDCYRCFHPKNSKCEAAKNLNVLGGKAFSIILGQEVG